MSVLPRNLRPMRLSRRSEPFDSDEFIYELKVDGFRALAYIENGQCDLVSRNGNTFRNFKDLAQWIGENLTVENAVIDSEIACIDDLGRSVFNDLVVRKNPIPDNICCFLNDFADCAILSACPLLMSFGDYWELSLVSSWIY